MKQTTYPLALIFFALCAQQEAAASPRVDWIARCALSDTASLAGPGGANGGRHPMIAEQDDLSVVDDAKSAIALSPTLGAIVANPEPRTALTLPYAIGRVLEALRNAVVVPLRYGCAVFGAGPERTPPPKAKKKPRMLTLF